MFLIMNRFSIQGALLNQKLPKRSPILDLGQLERSPQMNIEITARHFDLTPELKEHIDKEVNGLTRYFENIISSEVILDVEKYRQSAEIKVRVYRENITGKADTDDMYQSIEQAIGKVKKQLKKYKGKLKDKRPEQITETKEEATRPETDVDAVDI
jgi:putative sigma-54 modulation protein